MSLMSAGVSEWRDGGRLGVLKTIVLPEIFRSVRRFARFEQFQRMPAAVRLVPMRNGGWAHASID